MLVLVYPFFRYHTCGVDLSLSFSPHPLLYIYLSFDILFLSFRFHGTATGSTTGWAMVYSNTILLIVSTFAYTTIILDYTLSHSLISGGLTVQLGDVICMMMMLFSRNREIPHKSG